MKNIHVEKRENLHIISIERPNVKNAVDGPTAQQLAEAFKEFETDDRAAVAILTGSSGCFCSGADLKALSDGGVPNDLTASGNGPMGPTRMKLSKPVIAAIAGYAVAGGLELALWCDLRVAEESSVLGVFCRRWGVPLVDGGTIRLPRLIGTSRAMDLILTGRPVKGQEALEIGLVNRLVPDGKCLEEAVKLGMQIASFPQTCMRNDRMSAYEQWNLPLDQALYNEYVHGKKTVESNETFEGAKKFASGKGRHGSFDNFV